MKTRGPSANATNHDGPFCMSPSYEVCDLFPRPDETHEQFKARMKSQFGHLGGETHGETGRPRAFPALTSRYGRRTLRIELEQAASGQGAGR